MADTFVHPQALCESLTIGPNTKIWAFAQVMKGAQVGSDCNIGGHTFIESGAIVGDRVTVKNQVMIWDGVRIADDVFIGPGVIFTNDRLPRSPRMQGVLAVAERYKKREFWLVGTTVGKGAAIGAGSIITPGVTIGDYALIGAGALVTRDVPAHSMMIGQPARHVAWVCQCGAKLAHERTQPPVDFGPCRCIER